MPFLTVVPSRCNGVTLAVERRFKNKHAFVSPRRYRDIGNMFNISWHKYLKTHRKHKDMYKHIYDIYIYIFIYESAYVFLLKKNTSQKIAWLLFLYVYLVLLQGCSPNSVFLWRSSRPLSTIRWSNSTAMQIGHISNLLPTNCFWDTKLKGHSVFFYYIVTYDFHSKRKVNYLFQLPL